MTINITNIEKAKQEINNAAQAGVGGRGAGRWEKSATHKATPITVQAQEDNFNRKLLEYGKFQILLFPDKSNRRDKPKQLDSGLNHVMARIATKNKVAIGFNIKEIQNLNKKEKAIELGRLKQNIKICKKAKTKIKLINYKDKKDAQNFLLSLSASTQQAKEAI